MARLSLSLLGPFQVTLEEKPVTRFESAKVRALLAYLAMEADRPHRREALVGLLWPDWPERSARANLRNALSKLRRAIGDRDATSPFLLVTRDTIQFNRASDYWLDVEAFTELVTEAAASQSTRQPSHQRLEEAVALYCGAFLEGFSLKDSAAFDDWTLVVREQLHREALDALTRLAQHYEAHNEMDRAVGSARQRVDLEPWQEESHQQLMRVLALSGQRSVALAQYEICCRLLREELKVEPAAETTRLYERIRDGELRIAEPAVAPLPERLVTVPAFLDKDEPPQIDRPVFVARQPQLDQLNAYLNRALAGESRAIFVTGGPGHGKTALMEEFARRAIESHPDLLVASGSCSAYLGMGDPYLPFREVLSLLTGNVEAKWATGAITREHAWRLWAALPLTAQALIDYGPHLIEIFTPNLLSRAGVAALGAAAWYQRLRELVARQRARRGELEQRHIFGQYTNVLCALADQRPLLLTLDDLQWADAASISLLFHLGRRLAVGGHRILIVGAYRPEEVTLGADDAATFASVTQQGERHPLEKVLNEFKRHFGDVWVDLTQVGRVEERRFVDALLDSESNRLGEEFRAALYRHTGGHPLFTVELLRAMRARGELVQDLSADARGVWIAGPELNWGALPARVEAVIRERVDRLDKRSRALLTIASVEGERFTAQVIAQVQKIPERETLRVLSHELGVRHHMVRELGEMSVGGQFLSRYRFSHVLFQRYLYENLSAGERRLLHREVAGVLEELYAACPEEVVAIAGELAHHYAGDVTKELRYARLAGERAAVLYANEEALRYLSRALDLMPETDLVARFDLLLIREQVHDVCGNREAQLKDLEVLDGLAETLDDDGRRAEVALRSGHYAEVTHDYPVAIRAARKAIDLAQRTQDARTEATGYLRWGRALHGQGDNATARTRLGKARDLSQATRARQVEADSLRSFGVVCYGQDATEASAYWEQALAVYREIGDRRGEWATINNLGTFYSDQNDDAEATARWEQALHICREIGERHGEAFVLSSLGNRLILQGDYAGASAYWAQVLQIGREIGDRLRETWAFWALGRVADLQGDYAGASFYYEQALGNYRDLGNPLAEAFILAHLGLCSYHRGDHQAAQKSCQQARSIIQEMGSRNDQGMTLTTVGHALLGLGHLDEAADVYQEALDMWRELKSSQRAILPLTGLANVALARASVTQALSSVEEILSYLATHSLYFSDEPLRVYLTCFRVLHANQDARARQVLTTAHKMLQERAAKIDDEGLRHSFLENVAVNREILAAWEELSMSA